MNTKEKGDIAVGQAIAYFTKNGYEVCLPIGDKRHFDLIVEKNNVLDRVQVKYAGKYTKGNKKNKCMAALRITGGNQSFNYIRKYSNKDFDSIFVYTGKGECYYIPWKLIDCRNEISVECEKYKKFKIV
jgi:hypothetical protein